MLVEILAVVTDEGINQRALLWIKSIDRAVREFVHVCIVMTLSALQPPKVPCEMHHLGIPANVRCPIVSEIYISAADRFHILGFTRAVRKSARQFFQLPWRDFLFDLFSLKFILGRITLQLAIVVVLVLICVRLKGRADMILNR